MKVLPAGGCVVCDTSDVSVGGRVLPCSHRCAHALARVASRSAAPRRVDDRLTRCSPCCTRAGCAVVASQSCPRRRCSPTGARRRAARCAAARAQRPRGGTRRRAARCWRRARCARKSGPVAMRGLCYGVARATPRGAEARRGRRSCASAARAHILCVGSQPLSVSVSRSVIGQCAVSSVPVRRAAPPRVASESRRRGSARVGGSCGGAREASRAGGSCGGAREALRASRSVEYGLYREAALNLVGGPFSPCHRPATSELQGV